MLVPKSGVLLFFSRISVVCMSQALHRKQCMLDSIQDEMSKASLLNQKHIHQLTTRTEQLERELGIEKDSKTQYEVRNLSTTLELWCAAIAVVFWTLGKLKPWHSSLHQVASLSWNENA